MGRVTTRRASASLPLVVMVSPGVMPAPRVTSVVRSGTMSALQLAGKFQAWLAPLCKKEWVVHAKPPFGGPEQVLKYLARYTHRVAISNDRLVSLSNGQVTFRRKNYARRQLLVPARRRHGSGRKSKRC